MGLIVHDKIDTGLGFEIVDSYVSFHGQEVRISPSINATGKIYHIASRFALFKSKESCLDDMRAIRTVPFRTVTDGKGITDVYGQLYEKLKENFPNSEEA